MSQTQGGGDPHAQGPDHPRHDHPEEDRVSYYDNDYALRSPLDPPGPNPDQDERFDGLLLLEPRSEFDQCILGVAERFNDRFVLYSRKCVIDQLVMDEEPSVAAEADEDQQDPHESAMEHYSFNILGSFVGETTPGFLVDDE